MKPGKGHVPHATDARQGLSELGRNGSLEGWWSAILFGLDHAWGYISKCMQGRPAVTSDTSVNGQLARPDPDQFRSHQGILLFKLVYNLFTKFFVLMGANSRDEFNKPN